MIIAEHFLRPTHDAQLLQTSAAESASSVSAHVSELRSRTPPAHEAKSPSTHSLVVRESSGSSMNGLEYLKLCSTNVRQVRDIFDQPFHVLDNRSTDISTSHRLHEAAAEIRQQNGLCAIGGNSLWLFGEKDPDMLLRLAEKELVDITHMHIPEHAENEEARSTLEQTKTARMLEAIEGAVAFTLAQVRGLLHVAPWTWLFSPEDDHDVNTKSTVLRLCHGVNQAACLYLSITTHQCYLRRLSCSGNDDRPPHVILAPSGREALLMPSVYHITSGSRDETWKANIRGALQAEGVKISIAETWVQVRLLNDLTQGHFLWPANLCVATCPRADPVRPEENTIWRRSFGLVDSRGETLRRTFAMAEEWHDIAASKETFSPTMAPSARGSEAGVSGFDAESNAMLSPPFSQRIADHHAAMAGIYPTPPDGLVPGHPPQHLPASIPTVPQYGEAEGGLDPGTIASEENEGGRQSLGSSSNGQPGFQTHSEDLFGDMTEMDFATNEVGDADFDYFDVPDSVSLGTIQHRDTRMEEADESNGPEPADISSTPAVDPPDMRTAEDETEPDKVDPDMKIVSDSSEALEIPEPEFTLEAGNFYSDANSVSLSEDALSPFGIRERLLPPPIPASVVHTDHNRNWRNSTFDPILFNEHLDFGPKYTVPKLLALPTIPTANSTVTDISINLPPRRRKPRSNAQWCSPGQSVENASESESEEGSRTSISSASDDVGSSNISSATRKRKRTELSNAMARGMLENLDRVEQRPASEKQDCSIEDLHQMQETLLGSRDLHEISDVLATHRSRENDGLSSSTVAASTINTIDQLAESLSLDKIDRINIAQLVGEQAVSPITRLSHDIEQQMALNSVQEACAAPDASRMLIEETITHVLPQASSCDLSQLALIREPPARPAGLQLGKVSAPPQRPPPRLDNVSSGPDYFSIAPPYVRVQRGSDQWEMLPPALNFWNALGLGPLNGAKGVRHICLVPGSEDLSTMVHDMIEDVGKAYEGQKYGTFTSTSQWSEDDGLVDMENFDDGMVFLQAEEGDSYLTVIQTIAAMCSELGKRLARLGHLDPDRTIVVFIINPFGENNMVYQHLCICFWMLYTGYRDNIPKIHRTLARSDVVLRILPTTLISTPEGPVVLTSQQLAALASEIYSRCPPSTKTILASETPLPLLPLMAAPAVELASPAPKRVGFQLTAEAPSDLLHEGSIIHLAFALSNDRQWAYFVWIDATGKYQKNVATCLRGRSLADVLSDIWDRTMDILKARDITWRVFIVNAQVSDVAVEGCWRSLVAKRLRRQMLHVVLLTVREHPDIQLTRPKPSEGTGVMSGGLGFLTPVTTPQATNSSMIVSPSDASGLRDGSVAPPTPVSSDVTANPAEPDPDAYLIDVADESWGMLLSSSVPSPFASLPANKIGVPRSTLANAMLLKRGEEPTEKDQRIPALWIGLHWDVRIRPSGQVDEGPARQAEVTLREVLRMYRNLGMLSRARHLPSDDSVLPVHILGALRGADSLCGF